MTSSTMFATRIALIVALGGFLMGFDASVISGVVGFIELEYSLSKLELGWAVASLTLSATFAMMVAGPLSDRFGRRPLLQIAAALYAVSAVASAFAPAFTWLVAARMLGGLAVGAALIIAPMYIAEIAPAKLRGRLVSMNQLNIVVGLSAAFFSNYLILQLGQSNLEWAQALHLAEWNWRWMLGVEALPALLYFIFLRFVPESPRWLAMHGQETQALEILEQASDPQQARASLQDMHDSLQTRLPALRESFGQLFQSSMRRVLVIGIAVAVLQQITGINAVFFYAPMIFEQSGIATDAAFMQAVLVGVVNLVFTIVAIALIDRIGRRPLLGMGLAGIAVCMLTLSYGFGSATYRLSSEALSTLPAGIDQQQIAPLANTVFASDVEFRSAVTAAIGGDAYRQHESQLIGAASSMNPTVVLIAILAFVASFAVSLGPVMWVLFSELFPNRLRGLAISFVGLINSAVSFGVQLVFPWELQNLGNATTFFIYGMFAAVGFAVVMMVLPETKGRTLEQLEHSLVRS